MIFRMVQKSGQIFLPFCHNPGVWQTDEHTEFSSLDRVCIACSAVKTALQLDTIATVNVICLHFVRCVKRCSLSMCSSVCSTLALNWKSLWNSLPAILLLCTKTGDDPAYRPTFIKRQLKNLFYMWRVDEQKWHSPPPGAVVAFLWFRRLI